MFKPLLAFALLPICAGCTLLRDVRPIVRTETVRIEPPANLTAACGVPDRPAPVTVEIYIERMEAAESALDACAGQVDQLRAWTGKGQTDADDD